VSYDNRLALGIEILRLLAQGSTTGEAAQALHISEDAAKSRLHRLYAVLGARTVAHAVVIAGMERLLTAGDMREAFDVRRPQWSPGLLERARQQKEA